MDDICFTRKIIFGEDFVHEKHVNYLLKSLKKSTSAIQVNENEAHRLSLLFFIVSGLDLLGALDTKLSPRDKQDIIEWIYSYQVNANEVKLLDSVQKDYEKDDSIYFNLNKAEKRASHSGFRATSIIDSGIPLDCGVITMTYCALATLVILEDDLSRVDKKSIISGIKHLQLEDGSFKPSILGGETDMRLVYCAVAVSEILDDWSGIDKDRCASYIKSSLSYEGAFAQCPGAEAHGGSTFCALASLILMSKLDETLNEYEIERLTRWCINRFDDGFSGRPNKDQDTCYSFWIGATLLMLNSFRFIDQKRLLEFVLTAQEENGGLSKVPEFYSDPLHTYLGLAGLTFLDELVLKEKKVILRSMEPTLNISTRARTHLSKLHDTWRIPHKK